jgi:hypothetical protein
LTRVALARREELLMSTTTFRHHHRVALDAAIHRVYSQDRNRHSMIDAFDDLLFSVRLRSNLMDAPAVEQGGGVRRFVQLDALRNLARFHDQSIRDLDDWSGAYGHPLAIIDSLARHCHARYRTPRFLASVWFGDHGGVGDTRRRWWLRHAAGERFRGLPLPVAMTRRMEHIFLKTPDHLGFDTALRRAEVLGLGGSDALVEQVLATRLGRDFTHGAYWRGVLTWLVRCEELEQLEPGDVTLLVEHLAAIRETAPSLAGRTVATVKRDDALRREALRRDALRRRPRARVYRAPVPRVPLTWPKSQWADQRCGDWNIVELLSTEHLVAEGRTLRHCVGNYDYRCAQQSSTIWSMRRAESDEPVLTIEVDPKAGAIVMVRGQSNRVGNESELAVVSTFAARLGLGAGGSYARELESRAGPRVSG